MKPIPEQQIPASMLELMAREGMGISDVPGLQPADVENRSLLLRTPKSGREQEVVFQPPEVEYQTFLFY